MQDDFECIDPLVGKRLREQAHQILCNECDDEAVLTLRKDCICCAQYLANEYLSLKNQITDLGFNKDNLNKTQPSQILYHDQLSYAAGSSEGFRDIPEQALVKAGFPSGFSLKISEIQNDEQSITVISDTPRNFIIIFYDNEDNELLELEICQFPEYFNSAKIKKYSYFSLTEITA